MGSGWGGASHSRERQAGRGVDFEHRREARVSPPSEQQRRALSPRAPRPPATAPSGYGNNEPPRARPVPPHCRGWPGAAPRGRRCRRRGRRAGGAGGWSRPSASPPGGASVPVNPFIPTRWWRCKPPGREPPASRPGRRRAGSAAQMSPGGSREPIPTSTTFTTAAKGTGGGGLPGTWEQLGRAAGRGRFPPFGIPESSLPSGTGAVPHHPAQRPAASVAPLLGQASLSPRISMACSLPSSRLSQARRGAAPGAAPRLASRPSAVRAPKSGNYANTRDALCFDLNFLGMIPSHYGA